MAEEVGYEQALDGGPAVVDQNGYPPEGAAGSFLDMVGQDKYPGTERVHWITRALLK